MHPFNFSVDLHCHPHYKPFGRTFRRADAPPVPPAASPGDRTSIWHYDPPALPDKLLNYALGITRFRQANLTAAVYGNLWVMAIALGAVERGFILNTLDKKIPPFSDLLDDFVAGFGLPRIHAIEQMTDYWKDFGYEMAFWTEHDGRVVRIDGQYCCYKLVHHFSDLLAILEQNSLVHAGTRKDNPITIAILLSIEGLHALGTGLDTEPDADTLLQRVDTLKQSAHPPFFVTVAHHFWNQLCGHSRSLRKQIGALTNQEEGINSGIKSLGFQVIDRLLSRENGRRILIDIKHMSPAARVQLMKHRRDHYAGANSFPIIISHGVANGMVSYSHQTNAGGNATASPSTYPHFPELGLSFIQDIDFSKIGGDGKPHDHNGINFYDDEIAAMVASDGIMGLQLDERRLANDKTFDQIKHSMLRNKIRHYRSELLWRQVQYIGEMLDARGLRAWEHMAIGSDYDGLVDPINGFWTVEEMDDLASYLERHAFTYFKDHASHLQVPANHIKADTLIENLFCKNAYRFLQRHL